MERGRKEEKRGRTEERKGEPREVKRGEWVGRAVLSRFIICAPPSDPPLTLAPPELGEHDPSFVSSYSVTGCPSPSVSSEHWMPHVWKRRSLGCCAVGAALRNNAGGGDSPYPTPLLRTKPLL